MDPLTPGEFSIQEQRVAHEAAAESERKRRQLPSDVYELSFDLERLLFRLGKRPVYLTWTEFRIISLLASKPYKPFSPRQIVKKLEATKQTAPLEVEGLAPSRDETSVQVEWGTEEDLTEANLNEFIRRLRDKLGIFSDYIQSVPHMGYRFKP